MPRFHRVRPLHPRHNEFRLGANYWSRANGPRMWDCFDSRKIRAELAQMRNIGLNTCRCFSFIPSFMPRPPQVSSAALANFDSFLRDCDAAGIAAVASFLVGHMSGENYDFPGQMGRSPYRDPEILSWQECLIKAIAERCADQPALVAFALSNEMPLWAGNDTPDAVERWAKRMRCCTKDACPETPFGLGDGAMNVKGGETGFDLQRLSTVVDFFGPHTYYTDPDELRQALNAEYYLRSLTHFGLPVLFEEFGCSSCQASEENQALYYREVLHACLTCGAAGALAWCYSDFDLPSQKPYSHHAFELGFGLTRADGSEKPVCEELRDFSKLAASLDYGNLRVVSPEAAIVVPSYFNTTYPFSAEDRKRMRRTLLQTYVFCVGAGIEAELVSERANLERYKLLIVPSTQKLLSPTWCELERLTRRGATLYWSYFAGDYEFHQGAWCYRFAEIFGCRHRLRYACADLPDSHLVLRGNAPTIEVNTEVGAPFPRSFLPIDPGKDLTVVLRDARGRAALTSKRLGQGMALFCAYPLEYYLSQQCNVDTRQTVALYRWIGHGAGVASDFDCDNDHVQVRTLQRGDRHLLSLFNHAWDPQETKLSSPGGKPIVGDDRPLAAGRACLQVQPKQWRLYELDPD